MALSMYLFYCQVSDRYAEPHGFCDLTAHAMTDTLSANPQLIAGGQYPQPHLDADLPLGGYVIIQKLWIQQVNGDRRTALLCGIKAGGSGKANIGFDVPGIGGADIYQLHFAATAFTTVLVMLTAVCAV